MSKRKGVKTVDGKRNMKILPSTFKALFEVKGFQTWDECFMNLIKRSKELSEIKENYKEQTGEEII